MGRGELTRGKEEIKRERERRVGFETEPRPYFINGGI